MIPFDEKISLNLSLLDFILENWFGWKDLVINGLNINQVSKQKPKK